MPWTSAFPMGYAYFGPNEQLDIAMDDVRCTGNEATLQECANVQWSNNDCTHAEDAGVVCGGYMTSAAPIAVPTDFETFAVGKPPQAEPTPTPTPTPAQTEPCEPFFTIEGLTFPNTNCPGAAPSPSPPSPVPVPNPPPVPNEATFMMWISTPKDGGAGVNYASTVDNLCPSMFSAITSVLHTYGLPVDAVMLSQTAGLGGCSRVAQLPSGGNYQRVVYKFFFALYRLEWDLVSEVGMAQTRICQAKNIRYGYLYLFFYVFAIPTTRRRCAQETRSTRPALCVRRPCTGRLWPRRTRSRQSRPPPTPGGWRPRPASAQRLRNRRFSHLSAPTSTGAIQHTRRCWAVTIQ
jgi:hypothetical protein